MRYNVGHTMPTPDDKKDVARSIAEAFYAKKDPVGWFDALYTEAKRDPTVIPWADKKPNPHLLAWLDREQVRGEGRSALVVGCGLGDDAVELARRGFNVSAFDVSPEAISWCRERFPEGPVKYQQADLLNPPTAWRSSFDFIFEAYTIQALPRSLRAKAIESVASFVKPQGGQLLVVCRGREEGEDEGTLPWPLSHAEIESFATLHGLKRASFENFFDHETDPPVRRFRALFLAADERR